MDGNGLPERTTQLDPPAEFPFPFPPYDIQRDMMRQLYCCFEAGGLGVFQSPTGTGKSLSVLCSAMQWLRDDLQQTEKDLLDQNVSERAQGAAETHRSRSASTASTAGKTGAQQSSTSKKSMPAPPSWVMQKQADMRADAAKKAVDKWKAKIVARQDRIRLVRERSEEGRLSKRKFIPGVFKSGKGDDNNDDGTQDDGADSATEDADLVPRDYASDDDGGDGGLSDDSDGEEDEPPRIRKIFFCSRTHSQLAQFVSEVKNSPFSDVRLTALGSRQNLCTNPRVNKLSSLHAINEKCLDLQKTKNEIDPKTGKAVKVKKCPMLNPRSMNVTSNIILGSPQDIEEAAVVGERLGACAYYASRQAVEFAELVLLPYNMLLHKPTREAVGLDLKDNIVIVDEAHNLVETIAALHSAKLARLELEQAHAALSQYMDKFKRRLTPKHLMYIRQLLFVLKSWLTFLRKPVADGEKSEFLLSVNDFLFETKTDHMHFFKLLRYCEKSELHRKLLGYTQRHLPSVFDSGNGDVGESSGALRSKHISPLRGVQAFIESLTHADEDGRIVVRRSGRDASLQFMLLNPAIYFEEVLLKARAVAVVGGTMGSMSEFVQHLQTPKTRALKVSTFSCGHVVNGNNIIALAATHGPTNEPFRFTFANRKNKAMVEGLGRLLVNVCRVVPAGVVVFFPSYDTEDFIYQHWKACGVLDSLQRLKQVVREPRAAGKTDECLTEYSNAVQQGRGGLLFAVVGGKLSEGINFKDDLGRCVVMVGLPYPNRHSPALQEKMAYLDKRAGSGARNANGQSPGEAYYENLCMKAVNQSIGRAIRHRNDYAAILLVDDRYARPRIASQLPEWMQPYHTTVDKMGGVVRHLSTFFRKRK
ncbi:hypothetical protein PTSG_00993 [Salpingoeca rosetta]|uniref:DNA 5'-3' helicase n=1 Tax=Salpingoeca rosetta (strain ATCC 50818 / BSB-021) TaxID=946362 RepID=F2TY31_SALR5|nr:uncharacterized protein PTSG_00993 [Salpingoeca rosetta]EGD76290.1 hypothetical protein PTSG_00993 [Salpingoeca rosetta]|eukprot:XP_004998465.1 hypothetical protein PTSG_00993 [Salpingoeca rosetta]